MGAVGGWWWVGEQLVDLSGDVSFQAADDLSAGFAFGLAFLDVCDGGRVVAHTNRCDAPERVVGLAVPAPMLLWLSNRVLVGCEAGEPLLVLGGEVVVVAAASGLPPVSWRLALSLNPPMGVSERGDVAFLGLSGAAGGGFVRVGEVLAGFGRFVGVFGRVRSVWGRVEPVGDVLLMVCLVGSVRGQQSCGRLRTPARVV